MHLLLTLLFFQVLITCDADTIENPPKFCRNNDGHLLSYSDFISDSCARCYKYMPSVAFIVKFKYRFNGLLIDPLSNYTHHVNPSNISSELLSSFSRPSFTEKWKKCCKAAMECCLSMQNTSSSQTDACPQTWDGWQCWPDTLPGTTAQKPCPDHIYFEVDPPFCTKYALKECWHNATWYVNKYSREWTNFNTCSKRGEYRRRLHFHISTYIISILTIAPSLIIFMTYKQLQVPRVTMHKHFFLSQLLNGVCVVIFKSLIAGDELNKHPSYETYIEKNGPGCKILFILTKYFRCTNYMWMFCEGFYLQKLIASTFAEQKSFIVFYIIGWVFPILPIGVYAIIRATLADEKCWISPLEPYEWIMYAPNLMSLIVNLLFLCNIIRVLVTKLRATHAHEPSQYRKAVRATLVLVPLFGLHFSLVVYRPQSGSCGLLQTYLYFSDAMDGLQGFMVSVIFCFMNGEIIYLLKRTYERYKLNNQFRNRTNSMIMRRWSTTVSTINDSQHNSHHKAKNGDGHRLKDINHENKTEHHNGNKG